MQRILVCLLVLVIGVLAWRIAFYHPADSQEKTPGADQYGDPLPAGAVARIGTTRLRSFWRTEPMVFSPDGKVLITGDEEFLHFWDTATGKEIRLCRANVQQVGSLAMSPDGKYLAVGGGGILDVSTGNALPYFKGQIGNTRALAFSPDVKILASGGFANTINLWDVANGNQVGQIFPASGGSRGSPIELQVRLNRASGVDQLHFSADGHTLYSCNRDPDNSLCTFQAWNVKSRKLIGQPTTYLAKDNSTFLFFPDGRHVLLQDSNQSVVLDLESGQQRPLAVGRALAFSPDGRRVLTRAGDSQLSLCDASTGNELVQVAWPHSWLPQVAFTPDGKQVALAGQAIGFWDTATGKQLCPLGNRPPVISQLAFLPDGKTLLSVGPEGYLHLWDARTGKETRRFRANEEGTVSFSLSADGKTAAVSSSNLVTGKGPTDVRLWDVAEGKEKKRTTLPSHALLSPDGKTLAYQARKGCVILVDAMTDRVTQAIEKTGAPRMFSHDGKTLVTDGEDGTLCLWETTGKLWRRLGQPQQREVFRDSPSCMSISPDGKFLAVVWSGHLKPGTLHVWDVLAGEPIEISCGTGSGWVSGTCFTPDSKVLIVRMENYEAVAIRAFDVKHGDELGELTEYKSDTASIRGHRENLVISPDGRLLASLQRDGSAVVWDVSQLVAPAFSSVVVPGRQGGAR